MNVSEWIEDRTIYLARHGSHAYGTALPTSDHDLRGIAIPPRPYYLGWLHHFEQYEHKGEPDVVIFELRKFLSLAADCNPNVLEILFVAPEDQLKVTPVAERLLAEREIFLSKKARHTFSGYAISQLKRIETHRKWLLDPPKAPPLRTEFGLPERTIIPKDQLAAAESMMRKQVEAWSLDLEPLDPASKIQVQERLAHALAELKLGSEEAQWLAAGRLLGFSDNFLELLDRERHYNAAQRTWESYQSWQKTRNVARAALEAKHGYDTKHGMHLVRLMRMCREILATGKMNVRRPDAQELLSIRHGAWSYEQLMTWAQQQDRELAGLYQSSALPHSPDRNRIDSLCVQMVEQMLSS
jgi:predicted nucleotidyltransferase